jgi:quercetin dioxygenase-like cupin family protein
MSNEVWVKNIAELEMKAAPGIQGRFGRLIEPGAANGRMAVGKGVIPVGIDMGWHAHPEPEVFIVLLGQGEASWEKDGVIIHDKLLPGTAFYKDGGVRHRMANTGAVDLTGIFLKIALP